MGADVHPRNELAHWHPVLDSRTLRRAPVPVRLCGQDLVVFRGQDGTPAALDDRCAHRAMKLSCGTVEGGRLACPYHAWSYDAEGNGSAPSSPNLSFSVPSYEVQEAGGLVWLRARGGTGDLPPLEHDGYRMVCTLRRRFAAPLEPVIDNFADDEHTAAVHLAFGYDPERMHEVELTVETTDDTVTSTCVGPHKKVSPVLAPLFGIRTGDELTIDWTFHFSPLHSVFDMRWVDPGTGRERSFRDRIDVFFIPIDDDTTELVYRQMTTMRMLGEPGFQLLVRPVTSLITALEVRVDQHILANLADTSGDLSTMRLGRLDRSLGMVRQRLDRIYRQRPGRTVGADASAIDAVAAGEPEALPPVVRRSATAAPPVADVGTGVTVRRGDRPRQGAARLRRTARSV